MITTRKQALRIFIVLFVLIAGYFWLTMSNDSVSWNDYVSTDIEFTDGETAHYDSNVFCLVNKGDQVTLHIELPEEKKVDDATLCFYVYHSVINAYYDGEILYSYGAALAEKGTMIGDVYPKIAIPDEAWGGEINIVLDVQEDGAFSRITQFSVYPDEESYLYTIQGNPAAFVISIAMLVIALVMLIMLLVLRENTRNLFHGLCIVAFAVISALWIMSYYGFYTLFSDSYFWVHIQFLGLCLLIIPISLYLYDMESSRRTKKLLLVITGAAMGFTILSASLNAANIAHYSQTMMVMMIGGVAVSAVYACILISHVRKKDEGFKSMAAGAIVFLGLSAVDIVRFGLMNYVEDFHASNMPSVFTIGIFALLAGIVLTFDEERSNEKRRSEILRRTLQSIPTGVCQVNPKENMAIVAANDIFYQIIGYRSEDIAEGEPKDLFANLYEYEKVFICNKIEEILNSPEKTGEFEFSSVDVDNRPLTILVKYYCEPDGSRNITANVIDITERKRMEEALRISEEDYRTAIEVSDNLYFCYDAATKTCTHMFDSEKLFGVSEKVGNIPESLIELGLCAPESIDDYRKAFRMFGNGIKGGDFCLHLKNLKTHEYRWYGGGFRTIFNADGTPRHAIVSFKDITEQREKEIAYNIHKQQIEARSEDEIAYYELSITTGMCDYHYGLETKRAIDASSSRWNDIVRYTADTLVCKEYKRALTDFLRCEHLLELYEHGITEANHEFRKHDVKGNERWSRASVSIASDNQTHEIKVYCVMEDIEAEKAVQLERQTELEKSRYYEEAYDKLSSSVMYGVCKYNADYDLSIVFANDIFYQLHGYASQEEAVAAGFTNVLFATPPFGREIVRAAHREYTEGKAGQLFETEYRSVDADGNPIWVLCRGIYSQKERIFNSSVLNITDRKKAEEQLRVSEARYRLALSQSGKVFFFFDVPTRTMRLSNELAEAFGLPTEVDNMPDNFISQGLVEEKSVPNYRHFYERIIAGEPSGDTIISCHMRHEPEKVLWYKIAFSTIFDAVGKPDSAIITYEDLSEQRENELESKWLQTNLVSVPESEYVIADYNLTSGIIIKQIGALFAEIPKFINKYEDINNYVLSNFIYKEDIAPYTEFLDRNRLLKLYAEGVQDDSIEYRSLQNGSTPRWTTTTVQFITDPYSGDVYGRFLFMDIDDRKISEIRVKEGMKKLERELENNRIKVMINQMQPHFLYNALASIQMITKRDPDRAYGLMRDFTVHLRGSIKALSSDEPIPFSEELENVRAYLNIELMRMENKLHVNYEINCEDFSVVPLTIQPLVENAVKHGVFPKGKAGGTVTVRSYETPSSYVIEVEDDGTGFDVNAVMKGKSDSYGLKNLLFRLKSLKKADVSIKSKIGVGTRVTVTIPKTAERNTKDESDNS